MPTTLAVGDRKAIEGLVRPAAEATGPPVVLAEDDNVTAHLACESLRRAGFAVVRANNGESALEELERHHPDVLILDINMPRRDGLEVLRIVRRNLESARLRILVLSGHAQADVAERARRDGADDYLVKPFAPKELIDRVRRLAASRPTR
jgi:DNA-binding response OmpR family regulator